MGEQNRSSHSGEAAARPLPTRMSTVIPSDTSYLQYLASIAKAFCQATVGRRPGMDEQFYFNIELVMTEAVVNAIKHAYGEESGPVELTLEWRDDGFSMMVADYGRPFTEFETYHAREIDELDPLSTSGRGIIIMRSLMDHVGYSTDRETGRNEMTMTKRFPADQAPDASD